MPRELLASEEVMAGENGFSALIGQMNGLDKSPNLYNLSLSERLDVNSINVKSVPAFFDQNGNKNADTPKIVHLSH